MYVYRVEVLKVVDGDTVHARVDLGFDVRQDMTLRLAGINAPEMGATAGVAAKEFLQSLLAALGGKLFLQSVKDRREKYGRYLGTLWAADPGSPLQQTSLNAQMVEAGHAVVYMPIR